MIQSHFYYEEIVPCLTLPKKKGGGESICIVSAVLLVVRVPKESIV